MATRVVAAMSGGVDSSVVAALLVQQGYEVVGVTLNVWPKGMPESERERACCGLSSVEDARMVCDRLGIPHYVLNFRELFAEKVIGNFVEEYRRGRTPNPCVRCNEHIKFEGLLQRVHLMDCDFVATGHYVRLNRDAATGRYVLRRAVDASKDQSYVLYVLPQDLLARSLFPLGEMTKAETRQLARDFGLLTAEKPESQDLCFVAQGNYGRYLASQVPTIARPGPILDLAGHEVGRHRGIAFYTIGQRKGLSLAGPRPLYVVAIDAARNALVVGEEEHLYAPALEAEAVNWLAIAEPAAPVRAQVKIRYKAVEVPATVEALPGRRARIDFDEPQKSITPGQAVVFYAGDLLLGGGTIASGTRHQLSPVNSQLSA